MDSNFRSRRNQILSYLFLGMLLASARVQATGNPYFQVISGAWTSGASWSNGVPNGGSLATIDNAGTAILTTNGGTYNLVLGSNTAANALLITNGGNLQVGYTTSIGFNAASSNNYVLVNGAGSGATWASGEGLALGVSGASNTIIVTNGGIVTNEFTYEGQNSTSSNNSVVVTGSNSLVANLGFFYVGYGGGGNQLVISNGGKVTTGALTVGGPAGGVVGAGSSGNSAIVTGSNSLWSNSANLTVGNGGSSNTLTISAGGSVVDSNATVGILGTGNSALITGSNSIWRNSGTFTLGGTYSSSSSNLLTISNGGVLIDSNGEIGNGGNFNTVVVTGSNSLWSNTGTLTIGDNGGISNSLIVNSNGALSASSIVLGGSNSSFNTLAISGSGNLTNLTSLTIGGGGYNNTLTVTNALALAPPGSSISVGTGSGTSNSLVVTGPGATVSGGSGLQLTVGNGGNANSLVISNGASVTGTTGYVGFGGYSINPIGSSNTAIVTGSNGTSSSWTLSGQLEVGYEGFSNSLIISNGATVSANGIMIGQGDANSSANANNNSILVTGSNSVLTASGSSTITIGTNVANTNSLVISNGGKVFGGTGVIGSDASYGNFALVTGPGSLWSNSGSIYVGDKIYSGNGTLTVAANGTVTTTNLYVAYGTGSSGTVNYGTYGGSDTNFTINTPLFTFGNGAGTVNFNQANTMTNSTPFVGSNALAVDVIAQLGSGTTVLTSQGSTNNATLVVDGGQLILNGARFTTTSNSAPLSGNVYVGFQGQGALPNYSNNTPVSLVITNATQLGANEVIVGQGVFNVASDGNSLLLGNGTISSAGGAIGYFGNGNSALITGSNSLWSNSANLPVGNGGSSNTLTISAGGRVVDSNSTVGNAGSGNSALITGSGSLWSNTGAIGVGYAGGSNNSLVISNGATVDSVNVAIGYDGNSNSAIVTGSNSLWSNPGDFKIGYEGLSNSLVISNGATVSNGFLYLGYNSSINANNTVVVTGPGSTLSNNEGIDLGYYDNGDSITVTNGAKLYGAGDVIGLGGNNNTLLVTGSNSLYSNASYLDIGNNGQNNSLIVTNGATVLTGSGNIGYGGGSGNFALVTGSGSLWSNSGSLYVGGSDALGGNGTLTVSANGTVVTTNLYVAFGSNSSGTVNYGAYGGSDTNFNINTPVITFGNGTGTVNFNQANTLTNATIFTGTNAQTFDIIAQLGSGTTVLTGQGGTNSASLVVNGGQLILNGARFTTTANNASSYSGNVYVGLQGASGTPLAGYSNNSPVSLVITNGAQLGAYTVFVGEGVYSGATSDGNSLLLSNGTISSAYATLGDSGNGNSALITGSNSLWSNTVDFKVGQSSGNSDGLSNSLVISNGATVDSSTMTLGYASFTNAGNTVVVTGPGSTLSNSAEITIGYYDSGNSITVTNGAKLYGSNDTIGNGGNGNSLLVTGSNSLYSNAGSLTIGYYLSSTFTASNNSLVITNGAQALVKGSTYIGYESDTNGNNTVLVTGSGSIFSNTTGFYLGYYENGDSLTVTNGGQLYGSNDSIGYTGSNNTLLITGSNSLYSNAGTLLIGISNATGNSLVISNGATARVAGLTTIGNNSSNTGDNTILVTGTNSTLTMAGGAIIGKGENGDSITVTNGATLYGIGDIIGSNGSSDSLLVTGSNSLYSNSSILTIGEVTSGSNTATNNSLIVTGGAHAFVHGITFIGDSSSTNGNNTVLVSGPGSIFTAGGIDLGYSENGDSITVTNGAKLYSAYDQIGVYGSNNTLLVTGSNSLYSNSSSLFIAGGTSNSLQVLGGAQALVSGPTYIGYESGTNGNNTVLVSGPGSIFSNTTGFYLGYYENGDSIAVTNGAKLYGSDDQIGVDGSNNTLLVTGSNSLYSNTDSLYIAYGGASNSLQVLGGAHALVSGTTYIGYETGTNGNNTVLVSGSGSVFSNTLGFYLGYYENGDSITVTNGAKLYGNDDTIGYGSSTNGGNNNTLLVTGPGSLYSNSEGLTIGNNTNGNGTNNSLVISNGAKAILGADGLSLGNYSGTNGNNTVLVTGTNSTLDSSAGGISIGAGENGDSITVTNGAKLYGNDDTIGYINTVGGNSNTLLVTDTNSLYSNSSDLNIGQGANGNTLIVTNGAHALVAGDTSIGTSGGSSNSITVTGPGSSLIVAGNIMVGTSSGNANYLTLDNGAFVSAATLTVYSNSVLSGNGTITTTADPTINGGTLAPTGTNALVINGNTTFTNNGTFVWNLFNNSTNNPSSGTNFTVPVILNGNLNVTNSTLDVVLNNLVSATNSFWRTPGVTNSWVIIQGTNASIGNGLNFNVNFLGQTTDFALTDFSLVTNRADQLVLNYFYNTNDVDTIVTNNGTTNVAVSPGVNNNVTQNGSGTTSLGGSGAASLAIVVNNGTLNTTNTTGVLSPLVNVTVNGGVFGIQAPGTNVVNNFTVNGGTVLSPSNVIVTVTNPSGMNITGGNLSGGTFQAADYIFSPATTSSVSATLENLNTNSWAVITNNSGGTSGTTVFTTNMAYTGDTLITNATLQLGSGSSTGSVLGVITNYGVLDFGYNGNTNTPSNVVLGNGVIGQVGTGTLTIGTNGIGTSFTGSFAVANGTLAITTNSALGNSTNFYLANNGTLQATTGVTNITNANVTNGTGIIDNASGSTLTLNGTLKKSGTTLILTGGNFSVQGQITGSGTPGSFDSDLIISNATATLNAGNNNYVGPTTIEAGSGLSNGIVNALPTNTLLNVGALTDAAVTNTYNLAGYNQTLAGLASPTTASSTNQVTNSGAAAILKINGATNTVYAGTISGNLSMVRQGLGSTLLSGNNSYTGGTTINSGKLITANNNALGTGNVTLAGGTLQLNNILTISSFIWNSSTSTNSQVALPNASGANDYLNVTSTITRGSSISYFNLTGVTLNNTPTELLYFGTNLLTTGEFKVVGLTTHYKLFIENGDSLWINLNGTNNPTNGLTVYPTTTTVGNTATYSSATFLNNGILNITPTGNLTLTTNVAVNNNSTVILNGVLNVSNTLTIDPGSTLTGAGTLNGNLINSGFVGGPGNLTVTRNFIQNPTGTFILNPNGPSTSNKLKAGGSISLAGNLQVKPANGYVIQIGNSYNFLSAPGGISGNFAAIDMPSGYRGRFLKSDNNTLGTLLIAPQSYTQMAANRNQLNVASALNSFISATSGDQLVVSTSLDSLNASQYQEALNGILPNFYQSLATIAFNSANAQNSELLQRLWGLRVAEGGGFSMSGLPDNTAVIEGQGDGESPGKGVLDSKKDILRPGLDNHWGMFLDGNGIFAQANSANMLPGYTAESGGVTTGLTYKWNDNFGTGLYCGYEGTYAKYGTAGSGLGVGSSLIDNAVRFGVFGTYGQKNAKGEAVGFYANALAGGGYNNYQATRVIQYGTYGSPTSINRTASSSPGAGELDTMLAGGYDLKRGHWTYGPTASLQYTYLGVNPVNETGAQSLDFNSQSWNSQSLLSSVGAHAAYTWQANNDIVVVPQISLAWQHEFMQNPYAINGTLGGASPNFSNWSSAPIRDFLYTGVGVTVEFYKRWNASLFYNASVGNTDLTSENIFLSAGVKF